MTKPRLEAHPDYPFRPGREEILGERIVGFTGAPAEGTPDRNLLREFIALAHRFAFLERLIQGDILYDLPVHLNIAAAAEEEPQAEGERLAAEEAGLLSWEAGRASELADVLDEMGIKVLSPGGAEEREPPAPELRGAFYYEGEVGPALLVASDPHAPEGAFVLAHEFGHLVADIDPYRSRFCRWDAASLDNLAPTPVEERADRFARALLMPASRFHALLAQLGGAPPSGQGDLRCAQLAALFEVAPALVRRRVADLGLPPLSCPPAAAVAGTRPESGRSTAASAAEPQTTERPSRHPSAPALSLPERFVNLALAAYSVRVMEPDDLARFLETTEEEAMRIVAWANVTRQTEDAEE